MSEIEMLKARIQNTEKCLLALATIMYQHQPDYVQQEINILMDDFYDASVNLGYNDKLNNFTTNHEI